MGLTIHSASPSITCFSYKVAHIALMPKENIRSVSCMIISALGQFRYNYVIGYHSRKVNAKRTFQHIPANIILELGILNK